MPEGLHSENVHLSAYVPKCWGEVVRIWVTCYRVMLADESYLLREPVHAETTEASVVFFFGTMKYLVPIVVETTSHRPPRTAIKNVGSTAESSKGVYCVILAPLDKNGKELEEAAVRATISSTIGLLGALYGRNTVYEALFDNVYNLRTSQTETFSPVMVNPYSFPTPVLEPKTAAEIARVFTAIDSLAPHMANRVRLSLRWSEQAMFDDGIDAVLKQWIAIETLAMPDSTNIRPVVEMLAKVNGVTYEEARDRFLIGALYGLRSKIVHSGLLPPVHSDVLNYMTAVYFDILSASLGTPSQGRTTRALGTAKIDLSQYLRSISSHPS